MNKEALKEVGYFWFGVLCLLAFAAVITSVFVGVHYLLGDAAVLALLGVSLFTVVSVTVYHR